MTFWSNWMWAAIFGLSAMAFANEADALRVDKVYKVLFAGGLPSPGTEPADVISRLNDALPAGSSIDYLSVTAIKDRSFPALAEYSFVLWHVSGGNPNHADAPQAATRILAADLPVMIFDGAGFPVSRLFGLVEQVSANEPLSGDNNWVVGDTEQKGLYHAVLRNLVEFPQPGYEPQLTGYAWEWGEDQSGKTLFWVDRAELVPPYTRGLLEHAVETQNPPPSFVST
jgi:hypothetical protein